MMTNRFSFGRHLILASLAGAVTLASAQIALAKAKPKAKPAAAADAGPKGDAVHGQQLFNQCKVCHSLDAGKNLVGPSLNKIVGSKSAVVAGYSFSPAMQKANLTWNAATLSDFLTAPMKKVPGTKMGFVGLPNPQDRADIIAYLAKN